MADFHRECLGTSLPEGKRDANQRDSSQRMPSDTCGGMSGIERSPMGASRYREDCGWLRGVDLNHQPLGYDRLTFVDSTQLNPKKPLQLDPNNGPKLAVRAEVTKISP